MSKGWRRGRWMGWDGMAVWLGEDMLGVEDLMSWLGCLSVTSVAEHLRGENGHAVPWRRSGLRCW